VNASSTSSSRLPSSTGRDPPCSTVGTESHSPSCACWQEGQPASFTRPVWLPAIGWPSVGFTGDTRSYQRTGFVRKPFTVIAAAIKAVIGDPRRMRALLDLGRDAFGGDPPDDLEGTGEVVAIVVDNELLDHAGRDLSPQPAQLLLDAAIEGLRAEGVRRVRARVNADRRPALLLYARRPGVSYRDYRRRNEPMVEITLDI